jgi:hypothetical protein
MQEEGRTCKIEEQHQHDEDAWSEDPQKRRALVPPCHQCCIITLVVSFLFVRAAADCIRHRSHASNAPLSGIRIRAHVHASEKPRR